MLSKREKEKFGTSNVQTSSRYTGGVYEGIPWLKLTILPCYIHLWEFSICKRSVLPPNIPVWTKWLCKAFIRWIRMCVERHFHLALLMMSAEKKANKYGGVLLHIVFISSSACKYYRMIKSYYHHIWAILFEPKS